jgi:hypothetical protein
LLPLQNSSAQSVFPGQFQKYSVVDIFLNYSNKFLETVLVL